jgi:hypothetical protein
VRRRASTRLRSARIAIALVLVTTGAIAFQNEPLGVGDVRLGMTSDEVRKALPALHPGSGSLPAAHLTFFEAEGVRYIERSCKGRFAFLEDKLYEIGLDCGRDDAILEALKALYGKPTLTESYGIFWYGEKVNVSLNPNAKVVGIAEPAASDLVQRILYRLVQQEQLKQAAGGSTPAAPADRPGEQRPVK